jgi:hypothetical protein
MGASAAIAPVASQVRGAAAVAAGRLRGWGPNLQASAQPDQKASLLSSSVDPNLYKIHMPELYNTASSGI